jgi:hypothetical protein
VLTEHSRIVNVIVDGNTMGRKADGRYSARLIEVGEVDFQSITLDKFLKSLSKGQNEGTDSR